MWIEEGTPDEARVKAASVVAAAEADGSVPVIVVYNLPFRDCSQYSAGGAIDRPAYEEWVDAVAEGVGDRPAVVILEPDGLGIIPFHTTLNGVREWCEPVDETGSPQPGATADDRFAALNHAVDAFASCSEAAVYLDATHSAWLPIGDAAARLLRAGVERANGFFLNVSNFEFDHDLMRFGTLVSKAVWYASDHGSTGVDALAEVPDQFGDPNQRDEWFARVVDAHPSFPGIERLKHFVIDSSRNGRGPWTPPDVPGEGDAQEWCNPPGRGLGVRSTFAADHPLLDAYLWIKLPGESDGECHRWTDGPEDPVRRQPCPPAGEWFPELAMELARGAVPPLDPGTTAS